MKKILALLVAVMMMTVPTLAEMVIMQNGLAPEVVAPAEGVVLTDVSKRADLKTLAEAFAANLSNENVIVEMFAADITEATKVTVKAVADAAACVVDGKWEALAIEKTVDTVSFELKEDTIVALLVNFAPAMFEKITVTEDVIVTTEEVTGFTPSVKGKAAPALKPTVVIEKEEVTTAVEPSYLIITPLSLSAYSSDVITHEMLQWAYNDIMIDGTSVVKDAVNAMLADQQLTYDDMIVHDLFEASLYGEKVKELSVEGATIKFDLDAGFGAPQTVVVLYTADAVNWNVLPAENFTLADDGVISLTMGELGAIAFLTVMPVEEAPVTSPAN